MRPGQAAARCSGSCRQRLDCSVPCAPAAAIVCPHSDATARAPDMRTGSEAPGGKMTNMNKHEETNSSTPSVGGAITRYGRPHSRALSRSIAQLRAESRASRAGASAPSSSATGRVSGWSGRTEGRPSWRGEPPWLRWGQADRSTRCSKRFGAGTSGQSILSEVGTHGTNWHRCAGSRPRGRADFSASTSPRGVVDRAGHPAIVPAEVLQISLGSVGQRQ